MAHPLRILMVTPRYFPLTGGIETHVYEVARRLAAAGESVTILTTDTSGALARREEHNGVMICRVPAWPRQSDFYFAPSIPSMIRSGKWDVIHCQGIHTLVPPLAMTSALGTGVPYVLTFHTGGHSSSWRNAIRGIQWACFRPLLTRAARLIGVSQFEATAFQHRLHLSPDRFVVIPNGSQLPPPHVPLGGATDEDLIVSVGRLERYKGHQRVIAALPIILRTHPHARLRIVGNGPYESELRRFAQRLGVISQVDIGPIPSGDRRGMATILHRASVVTLLSDYEAHPIAVMEALGMGRPVVVADTSGLSEIAERGLARAIPANSKPEQVAQALLDQLERPFILPAVELPTWEECAERLLHLYRTVSRVASCAS